MNRRSPTTALAVLFTLLSAQPMAAAVEVQSDRSITVVASSGDPGAQERAEGVRASFARAAVASIRAAPRQATYATAAEIESLEVQAEQLDELVRRKIGRGEPVRDDVGQALTDVFGQIARFREIQRRHQAGGGEGTGVAKAEVDEVADRIAELRLLLKESERADSAPADETADAAGAPGARPVVVPEGTRVVIRLNSWLSSEDAEVGDRFDAVATHDVRVDGEIVVPKEARFEGYVAEVERARRASRGGKLTLVIDRVYAAGEQPTAVRATVIGAAYGEDLEGEDVDTGKAVTRGILGAIIGGLIGGGKGALIGIGIGSGGTLLAEKGEEVDLPTGTQLRVRFETGVSVTWGPIGEDRREGR